MREARGGVGMDGDLSNKRCGSRFRSDPEAAVVIIFVRRSDGMRIGHCVCSNHRAGAGDRRARGEAVEGREKWMKGEGRQNSTGRMCV